MMYDCFQESKLEKHISMKVSLLIFTDSKRRSGSVKERSPVATDSTEKERTKEFAQNEVAS